MVKLEEDPAPAELPMSPVDGDNCYDDEEDEEADSEGDGDGAARRRGGAPSLKKGPWTPDEDKQLKDYVQAHGDGNWNQVRINAGLNRCGKSCRLRWSNHLRPDLKKGPFDEEEVDKILRMHMSWGNKWAKMAAHLPGRTDNEIKNYWNTRLKRHQRAGLPIYPEYLVCQASNRDMNFDTREELRGTKRPNEFSQNVLGIDLMHEYFDPKVFNKRVLNMGDLPSPSLVVPNSLPMDAMNPLKQLNSTGCIASDYNGSLSFIQFPDESEKAGCSPSFNYGMTENQLAPLDNAITSCHPIIDGNPSTSWIPQRSMEMELPSFQYSNYDISNAWLCDYPSASPVEQADTLIESAGSLKSESISSQNTGLEAIAHNGDGTGDPMKSQEVSLPLPCNQVSQSFSSVLGDDTLNIGMLDASLEAFLNDRSLFSKDHSISINNSLIDGNSCEEAKLPTAGRGLDSFPWKSMPGACNISDFSNL